LFFYFFRSMAERKPSAACRPSERLIRLPQSPGSPSAVSSASPSAVSLAWSQIGSGASGTVYVDADQPSEAIKHLPWTNDTGIPSDVLIEMDAMARFAHPNVNCARSIVLDIEEKRVAIYQTRATHGTLRQLIGAPDDDEAGLASWRRSPVACAGMWLQMLHGVRALHQLRFMHGDLKPANILVTSGEAADARVLRVADLGLVQLVSGCLKQPLGLTVRYAAWEVLYASQLLQAQHGKRARDTQHSVHDAATLPVGLASDIFSLACLFFEMLSADAAPLIDAVDVPAWFATFYNWHTVHPIAEVALQRQTVRDALRVRLKRSSALLKANNYPAEKTSPKSRNKRHAASPWVTSWSNTPSTITRDESDWQVEREIDLAAHWEASTVLSQSSSMATDTTTRLLGSSRQVPRPGGNLDEQDSDEAHSLSMSSHAHTHTHAHTRTRTLHAPMMGKFTPAQREHLLDLLADMLSYEPARRPTVDQILAHPLWASLGKKSAAMAAAGAEPHDGCCFRRKPLRDMCRQVTRNLLQNVARRDARQVLVARMVERACAMGLQARTFFIAAMLADRALAAEFHERPVSVELLSAACIRLACKFLNERWRVGPTPSSTQQADLAHIELEVVQRVDGDMMPSDFWHATTDVTEMQHLFAAVAYHPDLLWSQLVLEGTLDQAATDRLAPLFFQPRIMRSRHAASVVSWYAIDARTLSLHDLIRKQPRVLRSTYS
jgi:serine/threonine protein kinase